MIIPLFLPQFYRIYNYMYTTHLFELDHNLESFGFGGRETAPTLYRPCSVLWYSYSVAIG